MKRRSYILAAGLCIFAGLLSGCGDKKQSGSEEVTTAEDGTVAVEVLDNDQITLVYNGYDPEVHGMIFTITNKMDTQMANVYFSDVVVDGETLQPMFGLDVEAKTSEDQICLVDCDAAPAALTGIVCVDDTEGYTIGTYEVNDVALSNDKAETKEYAVKDGAITVLDNDKVTVSYIGIEDDSDGEDAEKVLAFEVYNKTDKKIQATFDSVLVNDKEEETSYIVDALGHTYAKLYCDVPDVTAMTTLTGVFSIYDAEDELIDSYSIEKAALK